MAGQRFGRQRGGRHLRCADDLRCADEVAVNWGPDWPVDRNSGGAVSSGADSTWGDRGIVAGVSMVACEWKLSLVLSAVAFCIGYSVHYLPARPSGVVISAGNAEAIMEAGWRMADQPAKDAFLERHCP